MTAAFVMTSDNPAASSPWLRPVAFAVVAALHASALFLVHIPAAQLPSAEDSIEVDIAPPQGDTTPEDMAAAPDTMAQEEVKAVETPPDPTVEPDLTPPPPDPTPPEPTPDPPPDPPVDAPPDMPPEPPPPVAAEPPKVESPDAPLIQKYVEPRPQPKPKPKPRPAVAQVARHARSGEHSQQSSAASRASYSARVRAAIGARRGTAPAEGSVGVGFSVGASGGILAAYVTSSSGNPELDSWALRVVRSAHPGPPPGGAFAGSVRMHGG